LLFISFKRQNHLSV